MANVAQSRPRGRDPGFDAQAARFGLDEQAFAVVKVGHLLFERAGTDRQRPVRGHVAASGPIRTGIRGCNWTCLTGQRCRNGFRSCGCLGPIRQSQHLTNLGRVGIRHRGLVGLPQRVPLAGAAQYLGRNAAQGVARPHRIHVVFCFRRCGFGRHRRFRRRCGRGRRFRCNRFWWRLRITGNQQHGPHPQRVVVGNPVLVGDPEAGPLRAGAAVLRRQFPQPIGRLHDVGARVLVQAMRAAAAWRTFGLERGAALGIHLGGRRVGLAVGWPGGGLGRLGLGSGGTASSALPGWFRATARAPRIRCRCLVLAARR